MTKCSFFILIVLFLSSCAITHSPAPIEYNHKNSSLNSSSGAAVPIIDDSGEIISASSKVQKESEIITPYNDDDYAIPTQSPAEKDRKIIYHEVKVGETIEEISSQYSQTIDEIAMLNALYPPYYLEEFQVIKIRVAKDYNDKKTTTVPAKRARGLEFVAPLKGKIVTKFGEKTQYGTNKGINIAAKQGTKVIAAAAGKVIYADYDATFGYLVIIKLHEKNIVTSYAHLEDIILTKGAKIKQGAAVGYVGNTGKVNSPQLHFGIREGKKVKDPLQYVSY